MSLATFAHRMLTNIGYRRWSYWLFIASLSAIVVATVFPFRFVIPEGLSIEFVLEEFKYGSSVKDYLQNVLLFIPLGISLAAIANRRWQNNWILLAIGLFFGAVVSTSVELTQLLLPIRVSNLTDIFCNSLGSLFGAALYYWRSKITEFVLGVVRLDRHKLSLKSLSTAIVGYCTIVAVAVWILSVNVNLSNWNKAYYLVIGNEITGDRPWNGYLKSLYISDRSLEPSSLETIPDMREAFLARSANLAVAIDFTQDPIILPNNLGFDLFRSNRSASNGIVELKAGERVATASIWLNQQQWLKTRQPVFTVNRQLKTSSELSLLLEIATNDLSQTGPARIVALSDGIYIQNLLVGQEGRNLIFRLRTPITGYSATQPQFSIPNFFTDRNYHQILITFGDRQLTFNTDRQEQYTFEFIPSICFYSYLPWEKIYWTINLKEFNTLKYQCIFYVLIILPLIVLLAETMYLFT